MADVPTIVYDLALRSLDQQERELSELRARTSARDRYRTNKRTIDTLELIFQGAVLTLGLQTVLWALALALA